MPTDQPPPALRDLAEIDAPEVVRPAFRRFRRRVLWWSALVVLAAVWILLVYPVFVRDLPDQFASDRSLRGPVLVEFEHADVVVLDAQPLGRYTCNFTDCYGLHLLVLPERLADGERLDVVLPSDNQAATIRGGEAGADPLLEVWFTTGAGNPRVPLEFVALSDGPRLPDRQTRPIETVTLDLAALGYPSEVWQP